MSARTKEQRIIDWIATKPIGTRFYAHQIAKELNLTGGRGTGKILFRLPMLKNAGRCQGNTHVWEVIASE